MTFASIIFGFIIATLIGAVFHLIRGGSFKLLSLYILLSWIGFWVGQILASQLGWRYGRFGQLNMAGAVLGSLLFVFGGYWLSLTAQKIGKE